LWPSRAPRAGTAGPPTPGLAAGTPQLFYHSVAESHNDSGLSGRIVSGASKGLELGPGCYLQQIKGHWVCPMCLRWYRVGEGFKSFGESEVEHLFATEQSSPVSNFEAWIS
jgi:hypothetical protein